MADPTSLSEMLEAGDPRWLTPEDVRRQPLPVDIEHRHQARPYIAPWGGLKSYVGDAPHEVKRISELLGAGLEGIESVGKAMPPGAFDAAMTVMLGPGMKTGRGARGLKPMSAPPSIVTREITGSKDLASEIPATVDGKTVSQWKPADFSAFGEHFGVDDLGKASKPVSIKLESGRTVQVPGSFLKNGGSPPSYWDQLALKAQGINPEHLPAGVHHQIHGRMVEAVDPKAVDPFAGLTNEHVYNSLLFGLSSPQNNLTPNGIAVARTMLKSPEDFRRMAGMVPWSSLEEGAAVKGGSKSQRQQLSSEISAKLGLGAEAKDGLGVVGSADWTRMADLAKMMEKDPDFFRYMGDNSASSWREYVGKVASQTPGLSFKTASLGTVFQDPSRANISAIDRHMASKYRGNLHENPAEQAKWEKGLVDRYNEAYPNAGISNVDEMLKLPGGRGIYSDQALQLLGQHPDKLLRLAGGEFNPRVPEHYHQTKWVREPEKVITPSAAYGRALDENARLAGQEGRGIFSEQWGTWDPIRKRIDTHDFMNPKLSRIGRMNMDQFREARQAHSDAGYYNSPGEVRPVDNPSKLATFALPPIMASGVLSALLQEGRFGEGR